MADANLPREWARLLATFRATCPDLEPAVWEAMRTAARFDAELRAGLRAQESAEEARRAADRAREINHPAQVEDAEQTDHTGDAAAVEHLLANLDEPGPKEPDAYHLLVGSSLRHLYYSRLRVRSKANKELRKIGRYCATCGEHFQMHRITQKNCPACIEARKGGAA